MPTSDSNLILSFILLIIISGLTAYYADTKGRSPFWWFVLALMFSIIAPIILFFLPSLKPEVDSEGKIITQNNNEPFLGVPPPPPNVLDSDKLWYYLDANHNQYGPVSMIALKELWDTGQLTIKSFVWSEGMVKWNQVENLPALIENLKKPMPL